MVVVGIVKVYELEVFVGNCYVVVINFKFVKIFGIKSEGMMLVVDISDGKFEFVRFFEVVVLGMCIS